MLFLDYFSLKGHYARLPWSKKLRFMSMAVVSLIMSYSTSEAESLHDAIHAAWAHDPEAKSAYVAAQSYKKTADALDSLFPSGPTLNGQYLDDHFIGSKVGYTTYQGSVSVPLWLPGQGQAKVNEANIMAKSSEAEINVHRLLVSMHLIDIVGEATILKNEIKNLEKKNNLISITLVKIKKSLDVGEISDADYEIVLAEYEDIQGEILEKKQKLDNILVELLALTGTKEVPDITFIDGKFVSLKVKKLDPDRDPRVIWEKIKLKKAQATLDVTKHSYMPNPTVGVQISRQEQYQSPWDTQVGVVFQATLPSQAQNTPVLMRNVNDIATAQKDEELARRNVRIEYKRILSLVSSALRIQKHSVNSQQALSKRTLQLEKAWKIGEVSVIEYIRAQRRLLDAEQRATQANIIWHASLARMILMMGETP